MTTVNIGRESSRNAVAAGSVGLMGRMKVYLARSRAEKQLRQLDDRLLADIGVRRTEISSMVWGN